MANYKTPGVYIEEISKFPPSVAQVETAIPAFIGYTEKAEKLNGDTLHLDPTRITSLLEYETYFGRAKSEVIEVQIDDETDDRGDVLNRKLKVNQPAASAKSPYLMYYSMQLYFANGGGPCYIVSVAQYGANPELAAVSVVQGQLISGLAAIRKVDEATLLVFPSAINLPSDSDFWSVYDQAIQQCNNLQDRFAILDTYKDADYPETASGSTVSPEEGLRNGITLGNDYLKYSAAYYPYLETILNYQFDESTVKISHTTSSPGAVPYALANLQMVAGTYINPTLPEGVSRNLGVVVSSIHTPAAAPRAAIDGTLGTLFQFMIDTFDVNHLTPPTGPFTKANRDLMLPLLDAAMKDLKEIIAVKNQIVDDTEAAASSVEENATQQTNIENALKLFTDQFDGTANNIETAYSELLVLQEKLVKDSTNAKVLNTIYSGTAPDNILDQIQRVFSVTSTKAEVVTETGYRVATLDVFSGLGVLLTGIINSVDSADVAGTDKDNGVMNGRTLDQISAQDNAVYNKIKTEINALPLTLPPSSAMAGIYARVDSTRGVWKAPANVGLSYVIKPTVQISHEEQGGLNVHTTGKSINAIRTFTGKGTLVWGARTLAGNDNEWRYINVRRFFNMVEESVGKASEQFVFESNDANTWVRVRAMIENFLILQWKAGALAGAKAEQAFYVRVGLGQTMTAQDILEGRMIIEIGMAVVRPAEFIILRFSHKMQEA